MRKPLTVKELSAILSASFNQDSWGVIDPYLFEEVVEGVDDSDHQEDVDGLKQVLQRVVDELNERYIWPE